MNVVDLGASFARGRPQSPAAAAVPTDVDATEERILGVVIRVGLAVVAVAVLLSVLVLAVVHVDDRFKLNQVSGSWMALADAAASGTLYPPFAEDGAYGGSRYMPLPIVLHAGAALVSGETLVSGKLVACLTTLALLVAIFVVLRRMACTRLASLALVALVVATPTGLLAATSIRGDALSVLFQVVAVALVAHSTSRRVLLAAALLCSLAIVSKLTAVWAPAAIVLWLLVRERRRLPLFLGGFAATLLGLFALFEGLSGGRLSDNLMLTLQGASGEDANSLPAAASTLAELFVQRAGAVWLLLPFALFAGLAAVARRRLTLFQIALAVELGVLVIVFMNRGSDWNHLLDAVVLTILVVGELWGRLESRARLTGVTAVLALAVVLGGAEALRATIKPALAGQSEASLSTRPLAQYVGPDDLVLSEDPAIPLLLDQTPVLLDASMLPLVEREHPEVTAELRARIEAGEFDKVVLVRPIEDADWYANKNFGESTSDAIRRAYRFSGVVAAENSSYWVYVPAERSP